MGIFRQFPYTNYHDLNLDWLIKNMKSLLDDWTAYQEKWDVLYNDIETAFDDFKAVFDEHIASYDAEFETFIATIDITSELRTVFNNAVADGTISSIMNPVVIAETRRWLNENITEPVGVVIDKSLSVDGACADAKATGDKIRALEQYFEYLIRGTAYSQYVSQFERANTFLSTKVIRAGLFITSVRIHFAENFTGSNAEVYVIDNASKRVLYKVQLLIRDAWAEVPINYLCQSDCVIGFCGGRIKYRAEYATSPTLAEEYRFSAGLIQAYEKFPEVGQVLTISSTSLDTVFYMPFELVIDANYLDASSKGSIIRRINDLENLKPMIKETIFNGISILNHEKTTMRGVTYEWIQDRCMVTGTATGGKSQYDIYNDRYNVPEWIVTGEKYYLDMQATNVFCRVYAYNEAGAIVNIADSRTEPIFFTYPTNLRGCIITLEVNEGVAVNETVSPKIYKTEFNTEILTRNIYNQKAVISFIDDDTGIYAPEFWNPIINETGIRMGFACITGIMAGEVAPPLPEYEPMTLAQLKQLYAQGHEVYSHSYSHPAFYESTVSEIEIECVKSKDWIRANGFERGSNVIVYPGGLGNKPNERDTVRQFYEYGVDTYGGVNVPPIMNNQFIKRINADTMTLNELIAEVNNAIANKGHLVLMNHSYQLMRDESAQRTKIRSLIDYIKNNNAMILPFTEAIHRIYGW